MERIGPTAFDGPRLKRRGLWAVAFLADWCPFCDAFRPGFAQLSAPDGGGLLDADLTSLENPLWEQFRIDIVPSVLVFQDGTLVLRRDGRPGYGLDADDLSSIERSMKATPGGHGGSRPTRSPPES